MSVKRDPSGHRSVEVEAVVPGTPEEVWQAIATGPGVSSWFVPTQIEEREGGKTVSDFGFGPGMEAVATISVWEPPHRFVADSPDAGAESPPVATEWVVEAQSGGECVVRVVHRWFASTDDWDAQYEGHKQGWLGFFRILRVYLQHFQGQPVSGFQMLGNGPAPATAAWEALTAKLGLPDAEAGDEVRSAVAPSPLAGVVEDAGTPKVREILLLRLEEPAPGIAHFFAMPMGEMVYLLIRFYLFGEAGAAAVAQYEPRWQAWLNENFPPAAPAACD